MCAAAYGPTPGSAQEPRRELVVGQLVRARPPERLEVDRALGDPFRQRAQIGAAIAGAGHVAVEVLAGRGHRGRGRERAPERPGVWRARRPLAEVLDERADHPLGRRPGAVRRADRLDDVLEHGRAPHHPAGARSDPGERGVAGGSRVERGQVLVEPEDVANLIEDALVDPLALDDAVPRSPLPHAHGLRAAAVERDGDLEHLGALVDAGRRQEVEPVRDDCPPQVDRLAAGALQGELEPASHRCISSPRPKPGTPRRAWRRR